MRDWTDAWEGAAGLALSSWTSRRDALADPASARLLELCLGAVVLRERLVLHGYVILPGALHVVAGRSRERDRTGLPWPIALGRAKGTFARWRNEMRGESGAVWSERVRVLPLRADEIRDAVVRCQEAPVRAGLVHLAEDWPHSSVAGALCPRTTPPT